MKSLKSLSIEQILKEYSWPHRFIVSFAVVCAERAQTFVKEPDLNSLKAIDLAKRFSLGEDILAKDLRAAASAASASSAAYAASASSAFYAAAASSAAYAASAATAASSAASASSAAYAAYYSASSASYAASYAAYSAAYASKKAEKELKEELISMIKKEFSEFELIIIGVE